MAQHMFLTLTIETDGFDPYNRNRWSHNSRATAFCHAWPILLFVLVAVLYPLLRPLYSLIEICLFVTFSCKGFSQLEADLFVLNSKKQVVAEEGSTNIVTAGSVLRRTKQEVKSFQKTITQFADQAEPMAK